MTAVDGARRLDPDTLAALEEQRDFLLRSLEDLEREHDAGDVDDHDYAALKDDYTARAARTIRAVEAHRARAAAGRPPRSWSRTLATVAGVVAFALVAGVLVARFSGRREGGDALTGDIRESIRTQLDNAGQLAAQGNLDEAVDSYDDVLAQQPGNAEALAYKGWFLYLSGDRQEVISTLIDAAEADPEYPDAHAFLALVLAREGLPAEALRELDRLDALDPPPDIAGLVAGLRDILERQLAAGAPASTTTAPGG
jgi:tetratricopeptide (TPR) repeat protein